MNIRMMSMTLLCLLAAACAEQPGQVAEDHDVTFRGDDVSVKADSPVGKKIKIETVTAVPFSRTFQTTAAVRAEAGKMAEVSVPFSGRTTSSYVRLGQKVGAGQALFGLQSADYAENASAYFQAKSAEETARRNYERKKLLHENNIISDRDLEEVSNELVAAQSQLQQSISAIKMYGLDVDAVKMGEPLKVVSPISGEVVKCEVTTGHYVETGSEPLVTVADLSNVWVSAKVREHDAGSVSMDDRVEVILDYSPDAPVEGRIYYISKMLDEQTRTLEVIISCKNSDFRMRPGMYAKAVFHSSESDAVVIPSTAVMQSSENAYVYLETAEGEYTRRPVEVETIDTRTVRVKSGLVPGERIITEGGIYMEL